MAILKNKTQGNYTIVSQNIMRDTNLSLAERGMLLTLLSLPDNWHLTIMGLCQILPDGKEKISKTLNSLIGKGYVTRIQSRGNRGQFDSTDLEVHETPIVPTNPPKKPHEYVEGRESITDSSPFPENPDTVNPNAGNPYSENQTQYITNISNTNKSNINEVCKADTLTDSEYEQLVSEFGKEEVDYQIQRIKSNGYKGCCNYKTLRTWCTERKNRAKTNPVAPVKKNSFNDFSQRADYDFEELERILLCS